MLKHKKIFYLSLLLPVLTIFNCAKAKEEFEHTQDDQLIATISKTDYQNKESLVIDKVMYHDTDLTDKWVKKDYQSDGYFICTNNEFPSNSIVTNLEMTTNVDKNDLVFYIAHFDHDDNKIHLSNAYTVTIHNEGALKPWVWYTVTAVVIFLVVAMVFFTRRYKEKHG